MDKDTYKKLVKKHTPKEHKLRNLGVAFFVGGLTCLAGELIKNLFYSCSCISMTDASILASFIVIFLSSLFTALGFFDTWVSRVGCGLIVPTTGFAHSVSSSALEYKKDGLITGLGANFFRLAGSVILYGIISSFLLVIVRVIISG